MTSSPCYVTTLDGKGEILDAGKDKPEEPVLVGVAGSLSPAE
jgi:hypothetical protein